MENTNKLTDEELAVAYSAGDNAAFDELLARNEQKLFSYILFVVHDEDKANDIFQETFTRAIARMRDGRYRNSGKFSAWLGRIAHNVIMDWFRDCRCHRIVEPTAGNDLSNLRCDDLMDGNKESTIVHEQVLCDVRRMMEQLPPTQREVVFMRFYQNIAFKEIAERTNVSINTALGRMRYAVLNMRRMSRKHGITLEWD